MSEISGKFRRNFEALMTEKGLSQYRLANESGVSQAQISGYLSGKSTPSLEVAETLAGYFGISISELVGEGVPKARIQRSVISEEMKDDLLAEARQIIQEAIRTFGPGHVTSTNAAAPIIEPPQPQTIRDGPKEVKLPTEEQELLETFRKLSPGKRKTLIRMAAGILETETNKVAPKRGGNTAS